MIHEQGDQLDRIFYALSSPVRREMLRQVAGEGRTVSELAEPFAMSLAAVSKHVKVLEEAHLIRSTVSGRTHVCSLNPGTLALANQWLNFYERFWNAQFDALELALHGADLGRDALPDAQRMGEPDCGKDG
jgi:DNA-binding transcriptional ArsR family regulator